MTNDLLSWLIQGEPWAAYNARKYFLTRGDEKDTQVERARQAMLVHPKIQEIVKELSDWPGAVLKNHKSADHPLHKLAFLADLGLSKADPGISDIAAKIMLRQSTEGPFQVLVNIKPQYGGTGEDQFAWMLCDAPQLLYTLLKFGFRDDAAVQRGIAHLRTLARENGWPCAVSANLGKFRGPGRKADPCPYANLLMLKLLAQMEENHKVQDVKDGVEAILSLWQQRKERKAYLFGMGSDFAKLKAPLVWFDILHVTDVLSQIPWVHHDERFLEMIKIIKSKADEQGRFTPESVWMKWKGWDFSQKKAPSPWLTFLILRMLQRLNSSPV